MWWVDLPFQSKVVCINSLLDLSLLCFELPIMLLSNAPKFPVLSTLSARINDKNHQILYIYKANVPLWDL